MQHKREHLARLMGRLGILRLLEFLGRSGPALVVLTYHRIAEPGGDDYYDPVISATPAAFRAQVEWLSQHARVVTLDETIDWIGQGTQHREHAVLITFDDGYRDNFTIAAPILRELGLPATFFLPTSFVDSPRLPWWDQVACILKRTRVGRLELPLGSAHDRRDPGGPSTLRIDLKDTPQPEAIRTVIRAFLDDRVADESLFLDLLAERAGVAINHEAEARSRFATWDLVRDATGPASGLSIGSHGQSHRKLASLAPDAQRRELAGSRQILREHLGREVDALAYPYGWPGAYTAQTRSIAAESGYRVAFSAIEGINRPGSLDPFEVRRLGVGSGDSPILLRARAALHAAIGRSFL